MAIPFTLVIDHITALAINCITEWVIDQIVTFVTIVAQACILVRPLVIDPKVAYPFVISIVQVLQLLEHLYLLFNYISCCKFLARFVHLIEFISISF